MFHAQQDGVFKGDGIFEIGADYEETDNKLNQDKVEMLF